MSETVRPWADTDNDAENVEEPSWPQLIRRSVLWGIAAAVGGLLWYALPGRWAAVYMLALVVGIGVLIVRRDKDLWFDRPWEFVKKYPLEVIGTVLAGAGAIWWMFSLKAGEAPSGAVGYLVIGGLFSGSSATGYTVGGKNRHRGAPRDFPVRNSS